MLVSIKQMHTTLLWVLYVEVWSAHSAFGLQDRSFFKLAGFDNASLFEPRKPCAMFLGSGPSAMHDLNALAPLLDSLDLWSSNFFFLHPFIIPAFYHVEIKAKKPVGLWDSSLREYSWLAHFQQNSTKRHLYNDVLFFAARTIHRSTSELGMEQSTSYKRRMPLGCVLKSKYKCDQSIKFIISTMVASGYKYIFLLGVDMYTADYFWSQTENKHLFEGMHLPDPTSERFKAHRSNASVHNNLNCNVPLFFNRLSKGCHQSFINLSPRSPLKHTMDTFHVNDLPADILQTCSSKGEGME